MRFVLGIVFLFFLPGHFLGFVDGLVRIASIESLWHLLLAGFVAGSLLWALLISRLPGFLTFEHEMTHALVALLFLRRITGFKVTWREGGYVGFSGGLGGEFGNHMIGLAPYFLPTFAVILAIVGAFMGLAQHPGFLLAIGGTLAYHTFSTIRETKNNWHSGYSDGVGGVSQTDIGKRGHLYSVIVISSLTLAMHALVWWLVFGGLPVVPEWLAHNWHASVVFYESCWAWLMDLTR